MRLNYSTVFIHLLIVICNLFYITLYKSLHLNHPFDINHIGKIKTGRRDSKLNTVKIFGIHIYYIFLDLMINISLCIIL